nr:sigma-54-dependent Fis family transcriptional regulator [Saprospiraceae bacterium]
MNVLKIFIVEDDEFTAEMLKHYLSLNPENDIEIFHTGKECIGHLNLQPDVVCLDYFLPDENGEKILKILKRKKPDLPVIMVSGQEDVSTAVNLLKDGAYDYVVKDENFKERLWNIINHIRKRANLDKQVSVLQQEVEKKYDFSTTIIGDSPAISEIFPLIEKAFKSEIVVSITGETGTGKEVVAKTIHYNSNRKDKPFVQVNMAAIPNDLIKSELFGHEKGAFTGAIDRRAGKFEEAQGGTIFLDEIGDMDTAMQVKILRVLQKQQVTRIGSNEPVNLDVRVIIATHKNLMDEIKKGKFREDLYYRLLGISISLPPLRERGNDVILMANYFIEEYCKKNKLPNKKLNKWAVNKLLSHDYPGNVRELKSIVELAVVMTEGEVIDADHLQIKYTSFFNEMISREMTLEKYNDEIIKHFLKRYNNKVRVVADKLDIGKSTIYRMLASNEDQ